MSFLYDVRATVASLATRLLTYLPAHKNKSMLSKLVKEYETTARQEINDWATGRNEAKNPYRPRRTQLIRSYQDALLDTHLYMLITDRIARVQNKSFIIRNKSGNIDYDKTKLLQKEWFKKYLKFTLEAQFFGYSLIEFERSGKMVSDAILVPRQYVEPTLRVAFINTYAEEHISIDNSPYTPNLMLKCENPDELGLLEKCVPLTILKRHAWYYWDRFAELFGIPIRIVKTAAKDPKTLAEIDEWLENMGTQSYGRFPMSTELDIKESSKTDAFQVFSALINSIDAQLSKIITHQTMSFDTGSSRAQSESHERTYDQLIQSDLANIAFDINDKLMPYLNSIGYNFAPTDQFEWHDQEQLSTLDRAKVLQIFLQAGYKFQEKDIEEITGYLPKNPTHLDKTADETTHKSATKMTTSQLQKKKPRPKPIFNPN